MFFYISGFTNGEAFYGFEKFSAISIQSTFERVYHLFENFIILFLIVILGFK